MNDCRYILSFRIRKIFNQLLFNKMNIYESIDLFMKNPKELHHELISCVEGHVIYDDLNDPTKIGVYLFNLKPEFRRKGILTKFINKLSDIENIDEIYFFQCHVQMRVILLTMIFKGRYFTNLNSGKICWYRKDHEKYDHDKSIQIYNLLLPALKIPNGDLVLFLYTNNLCKYV